MLKTAECVSPSHPDKMCDQISDAILDFCLKKDPNARVAIETMGGHGKVMIMGELTMKGNIDKEDINNIVERIAGEQKEIETNIVMQSPEIANGVDTGGAGDQGIMVGYACNDNEEFIPQEMYLSRSLCKFIYDKYPYDGKTQVTLGDDGYMSVVVASFQNVKAQELRDLIEVWIDIVKQPHAGCVIHCNPAGDWNQGGFEADTGLTGRKLMVDNYGPQVPIGGGCFSGKDATKVDRSGAYIARRIAVDMLREIPEAKKVGIKLAYAIGVAKPVMQTALIEYIDGKVIGMVIPEGKYDLTPKGIIEFLKLKEPKFEESARWGHFGNKFNWDK